MRGLEHHHMTLKSHHTCHMPCHHFLCYSFVINELWFFLYLVNFQNFNKSFNNLPYFYILVSNCKNDFIGALKHHHMNFQPHHTCHIIIHTMSFPLSLMNSFDINGNHTQHKLVFNGRIIHCLLFLQELNITIRDKICRENVVIHILFELL